MGNQSGIGNYDCVQLYNVNTANGAYVGSGLLSYIATDGKLVSTTRHWERIKNYNVAVDFGFLNGKLIGTVEAFLKKNDDMLVEISYPAVLGDDAPTTNSGKFKGWGYEGQATWRDKIGDWSYYVGGTLTFARNELTDYGGTTVLQSGYVKTQQGYALNTCVWVTICIVMRTATVYWTRKTISTWEAIRPKSLIRSMPEFRGKDSI